jgi:hypothetical protein
VPARFAALSDDDVCTGVTGFVYVLGVADHVTAISRYISIPRSVEVDLTYYSKPALWSFSIAHCGGIPTALTNNFAPLSMTMLRSSPRLPPV